jgi:dienelactone hydrolase
MLKALRKLLFVVVLPIVLLIIAALIWLRIDASRPLNAYFDARQGALGEVEVLESRVDGGQLDRLLEMRSDSGLRVRARVVRPSFADDRLPVLIILGGHRTGSDAVDLFGDVGAKAVVALDYPYEGPQKVRGIGQIIEALPLARRAFRDTPPSVSLVVDWLEREDWADSGRLVIVGASLGVPFATLAAARDQRLAGAILVHGAADNLAWLEVQVARRNEDARLHRPLATLIHWLAYGPTFDTARNVAVISPRPVVIVGATEDERTPPEQTEALFRAAKEPKLMRWTDGRHVQPDRAEIVGELLRVADEVLPFVTGADT